jgi:hypothetical protein
VITAASFVMGALVFVFLLDVLAMGANVALLRSSLALSNRGVRAFKVASEIMEQANSVARKQIDIHHVVNSCGQDERSMYEALKEIDRILKGETNDH